MFRFVFRAPLTSRLKSKFSKRKYEDKQLFVAVNAKWGEARRVDLVDVDRNFFSFSTWENFENVETKVLIKTAEAHLLASERF